ncbi:MAG: hypothetical protein IPJ65_12500 [Archangiaceae bacterium]|nr:hypothetical protein [Archangiaceae bacterium]
MKRALTLVVMVAAACRDFDGAYQRRADAGETGGGSTAGGASAGGAAGGTSGGSNAGGIGGGAGGSGGGSGGAAGGALPPCTAAICSAGSMKLVTSNNHSWCTGAVFERFDAFKVYCRGLPGYEVGPADDGGLSQAPGGIFQGYANADGPLDDTWAATATLVLHAQMNGSLVDVGSVPCNMASPTNVSWVARNDVWISGEAGGACHVSPDGGAVLSTVGTADLSAIFMSQGVLFVGTVDGRIYRAPGTLEFDTGAGAYIDSIHGTDPAHMWATTDDGELLSRLDDGGWKVELVASDSLTDVRAFSTTDVWVSGTGGIWHKTDGGFQAVPLSTFPSVTDFSALGIRGDENTLVLYGRTVSTHDQSKNDGLVYRFRRGPR